MDYLFIWIAFAVVVAAVAHRKRRNPLLWLIYSLLLCPIAVIHVIFARVRPGDETQDRQKCPFCAAHIKVEARICRHCNEALPEGWSATWRRAG